MLKRALGPRGPLTVIDENQELELVDARELHDGWRDEEQEQIEVRSDVSLSRLLRIPRVEVQGPAFEICVAEHRRVHCSCSGVPNCRGQLATLGEDRVC